MAAVLALACCPVAAATSPTRPRSRERYAPVVALVEQLEECGHGEPYRPIDVDLLFDEPTSRCAARGIPWTS